jgi:hypothetical protein
VSGLPGFADGAVGAGSSHDTLVRAGSMSFVGGEVSLVVVRIEFLPFCWLAQDAICGSDL